MLAEDQSDQYELLFFFFSSIKNIRVCLDVSLLFNKKTKTKKSSFLKCTFAVFC